MTSFIARRNYKGNLTLNVDGVRFGTIFLRADDSVCGGAFVDDEVFAAFRRLGLSGMPADTIPLALARARRAYELAAQE